MAGLFSPLALGQRRLRNRIVQAPLPTGAASPGGFVSDELRDYYVRRAAGGVGLIITEPISVIPLDYSNVLALHSDSFISGLHGLCREVQSHGAALCALLSYPLLASTQLATQELEPIREAFVAAAWRAHAAGCDVVMLHGADGALLHQILSPHTNQRDDRYGGDLTRRAKLALETVEAIRHWLGSHICIGFRLCADDLIANGMSLQDSRITANWLVAAGVGLLDITAGLPTAEPTIAQFPGWQLPLVSAIRPIVDVPIVANGALDDPEFADSLVADGVADLIGVAEALDGDPLWPKKAAAMLGITLNP